MTTADLPTLAHSRTHLFARPSIRLQWLIVTILLVAAAAVSRFGLIAWPFWNDSGLYIALGRSVARGAVMYRDFYETKLPGVGMLMSAAWRAFGPCWPAYVSAQFAMTLLAAASIARAVHRHIAPAAALPCFLYAVVYLNFDYAVFTGFQLETIQAMFECLAAAAAIEAIAAGDDWSAATAGLCAGVAAMAKPGGIAVALALLTILFVTRRWRGSLATIAGASIPTAAMVFFAIATGAWPYLPGVLGDLRRYTTGTPPRWDDFLNLLVLLLGLALPYFVARAPSPWASTCADRRQSADQNQIAAPAAPIYFSTPTTLVFTALWFALDFTAAIAQRRMYLYYFLPLAAPAAILFGHFARKTSPTKIALGLLPVALLSFTWEACDPAHWSRGMQTSPLSNYIVAHTTATDRVWIDPPGRVTIETDRDPGASAGLLFYWANDDTAPQRYCERLIADLESRRTKFVILSTAWDVPIPPMADGDLLSRQPARRAAFIREWARFRAYVHSHYDRETTIEGNAIFRRNQHLNFVRPSPLELRR